VGPELLIVALGYYMAIAVAVVILIGLATKKTRSSALIVLAVAAAMSTVGLMTARPYWEVPTAALYFAVAGILAGLAIAGRSIALRFCKRSSQPGNALASD
jgi:presenilin-like A22 family membrane protease